MPTLHVRNVPEETYEALRARAAEAGTSIGAETVRLLQQALRIDLVAARALIDEIDRERPKLRGRGPSPAALIRRDREAR